MNDCDKEFRKWYDARIGTKYESFAYDAWCAAWKAARKEESCRCTNPVMCDLNDRCMRAEEKKNG